MDGWSKFIIGICILIFGWALLRGCSSQAITRSFGGEMDVTLEPNQKLLEVTWKDDSLWFLTTNMKENDIAESYDFYEKDALGILEGCVHIKEIKLDEQELEDYNNQKIWAGDYYNSGNYDNQGEPIFINYNMETDEYTLIKPYSYNEYGELVPSY